ncbi:malonate decarboxylase acyl carrier protein [Noviherbaspirillum pedocola]|uniref:Malonate decarboxylase acyl carrier protein n=1 Tax=Noviherbaspirillum pedocola TaxID=2801341 RepID=A0A934STX0_9BURK|nr:malonate decarboxylase acyl carrier protein [Noviherbaspirillum pedocola]MBK4735622.1 malonate decarboxylase acyl carrier protein [Noviherbaspirillum pedocola]
MQRLSFRFDGGNRNAAGRAAQLVGVVASGNLEVLIEPVALSGACEVDIQTAAVGFDAIWAAVLADFHERWHLADLRISINDVGATPAVVSLRLDQAAETILGEVS